MGTGEQTDFVYVNVRLKAKLVGAVTYYFHDALGSVRQVWKQGDGSPYFKVKTYKPFGVPIIEVNGNEMFRHASEILDAPTGLYYQHVRYMDPELGR